MNAKGLVFAAGLLVTGYTAAQTVDLAARRLEAEPLAPQGPLAAGFKRTSPVYVTNETANPNDRLFKDFRTDPRLVLGYAFSKNLALEAGYSHLRDEGFHRIDANSPVAANSPVESAVAAGTLGAKSFTTYVAAKVSMPLSERLAVYGKLGVAHSEVKNDGFLPPEKVRASLGGRPIGQFLGDSGTGPFGAVGAQYKLNDKATLNGEVRMNGSAAKFGNASNASAVKGSIGLGF